MCLIKSILLRQISCIVDEHTLKSTPSRANSFYRSALLFDGCAGQDDDISTVDSKGDDDLNSLMDRGLEEVDDLLNTKGRLSVFGPAQVLSKETVAEERPSVPPPGQNEPGDGSSMGVARHPPNEGLERNSEDLAVSSAGPIQNPSDWSARGAGAHAANVLMSATTPAGSTGPIDVAPSRPGQTPARLEGGSPGEDRTNVRDGAVCHDEELNLGEEATRRRDGLRFYDYKTNTTGDGVVAGNVFSPPRRRAKGEKPFIQAKDVTLTYAQAKLFGLAGSSRLAAGPMQNEWEVCRSTENIWPGSGSPQPRSKSAGLVGRTHDDRGRRRHQHNAGTRTYSPSRMEHLAQPVPGRGRVGASAVPAAGWNSSAVRRWEQGRGGGGAGMGDEATFTWKRSKKAEAAMR